MMLYPRAALLHEGKYWTVGAVHKAQVLLMPAFVLYGIGCCRRFFHPQAPAILLCGKAEGWGRSRMAKLKFWSLRAACACGLHRIRPLPVVFWLISLG
jgi:hypothetical protein